MPVYKSVGPVDDEYDYVDIRNEDDKCFLAKMHCEVCDETGYDEMCIPAGKIQTECCSCILCPNCFQYENGQLVFHYVFIDSFITPDIDNKPFWPEDYFDLVNCQYNWELFEPVDFDFDFVKEHNDAYRIKRVIDDFIVAWGECKNCGKKYNAVTYNNS